jgi:sugar/nucleoside kinase (ribokinase family)
VITNGGQKIVQPSTPVENLIDSTGAGDAYTAGFLFGYTQQKSLEECAKLGTFCATQVIQQIGARIEPGLLDNYKA